MRLHWIDHAIIVVYVGGMMRLGWRFSKRQRSDDEYFLGSRRLPWLAVGLSVIASLLSSLTYLGEPGFVWRGGFANLAGKLIAIPLEMLVVYVIFIPFFVRMRYTSAYEYLEHRFGLSVRILGAAIFLVLVVSWMGVIVLTSSRALAQATGMDLGVVIGTVGVVATIYTLLGGMRAVVWTDVIQVVLLVGGGLFILAWVGWTSSSTPLDWIGAVNRRPTKPIAFFDPDPTVPVTTMTLMAQMFVWHICTQSANQMTMQRYFSTEDYRAARRSFLASTTMAVFLNVLLVTLGASLVFYYTAGPGSLPAGIDLTKGTDRDSIFPGFIATELPAGAAGAMFAALLAAAMSTIDSGVNSVATVATVDFGRLRRTNDRANHVRQARLITLLVGLAITGAAIGLDRATGAVDIIEMMPKSFNCFLGSLGGMFLAGLFIPRVGSRAVWPAAIIGLTTALGIAYSGDLLPLAGPALSDAMIRLLGSSYAERLLSEGIGFTWVLPVSCAATVASAWLISLGFPNPCREKLAGLTWWTRDAGAPDRSHA